jgi:hypothetical protein
MRVGAISLIVSRPLRGCPILDDATLPATIKPNKFAKWALFEFDRELDRAGPRPAPPPPIRGESDCMLWVGLREKIWM